MHATQTHDRPLVLAGTAVAVTGRDGRPGR